MRECLESTKVVGRGGGPRGEDLMASPKTDRVESAGVVCMWPDGLYVQYRADPKRFGCAENSETI